MLKSLLFTISITLFSSLAHADFIASDWKSSGDAQATLDDETGLEWLRLSNTQNMTYSEVVNELQDGGQFEGWRFPTTTEIRQLVLSTSSHNAIIADKINDDNYYRNINYNSTWANTWRQVFGTTQYSSGYRLTSFGVMVDDDGDFNMYGVARYYNPTSQRFYINWENGNNYTDHNSLAYFLVSEGGVTLSSINDPTWNQVAGQTNPVPSFAFGAGLLAFLAVRKVNKKA